MTSGYGGQGRLILGITWTETAVGTCLVLLRASAASVKEGRLRWDFFWVAMATVIGIITQSLITWAVFSGFGNHIAYLDLDQIAIALKLAWICCISGLFATLFSKAAIIALLRGIEGSSRPYRAYFLHFLWITNLILNIVSTVLTWRQCIPVERMWDPFVPDSNCDGIPNSLAMAYAQAAWSAFTDLVLALYPIIIVWHLRTSMRMKVGFCVLMSGGLLATLTAVLKTSSIHTLKDEDLTYEFGRFWLYATTEFWLIIVLGSIPPLRAVLVRLFAKPDLTIRSLREMDAMTETDYSQTRGPGDFRDMNPWNNEESNVKLSSEVFEYRAEKDLPETTTELADDDTDACRRESSVRS